MSDETPELSDFDLFLREMGLTHADLEGARPKVIFSDMTILEQGVIYIKESDIEGQGVFAKGDIDAGAAVCPVMGDIAWSLAGRYMNHSGTPNVDVQKIDGRAWFVALVAIPADTELTVNYRSVRDALA